MFYGGATLIGTLSQIFSIFYFDASPKSKLTIDNQNQTKPFDICKIHLLSSFPQTLWEWSTLPNHARQGLKVSSTIRQPVTNVNLRISKWIFYTFTFCTAQGFMTQLGLIERGMVRSGNNEFLDKLNEQAGAELGQAQIKLGLGFTSIRICFIELTYKSLYWLVCN